MKKGAFFYIITGAVVGGIAVWVLSTGLINNSGTSPQGMMGFGAGSRSVSQNAGAIDGHFIEQMIPHHEDAITMSSLAQTKAKRPEVKQLAESIMSSQGKEIEQMKAWYKEWFGDEVPTGETVMGQHGMMGSAKQNSLHMGMMGNETDTTRLEETDNFDREFIEQMIPHHQMAVMMASMLKNGTQRQEMKKLADDIITAQTKEIDQMRSWLNEWGN